jgi:uncharacterized membrane protein
MDVMSLAHPGWAPVKVRIDSIDILRGLVILIMALDHVRDYLSVLKSIDTTTMTPPYFFTRWISHFCAPVFCFLAGTGAYLSLGGGRRTVRQLSGFLITRGLWLVLIEFTVIGFGWSFNTTYTTSFGWFMQVIWVLGASMIVLAGLVRLPMWASVAFGLTLVAGHNLLDGVGPASFGTWGPLWNILHVFGPVMIGPVKLFVAYPLIPWAGVMALGPSIALLAWMERWKGGVASFLATFGRVPFFFYLVHVYVIHTMTVAAGWLQGFPASAMLDLFLFLPKEFGFSLPVIYLLWVGLVLLMYPLCRWFASVKANHRHPLLSYL